MKAKYPARSRLNAGEARLWATLIVGVAYWADVVREPSVQHGLTLATVANSILDNGAFDAFAWALVFARCVLPWDGRPASWRAVLTTLLLGIVVLVPVRVASALALSLLGGLLFADPQMPRASRQMRPVLLMLAFEAVWMSSLLAPLHVLVGSLDARVAGLLLGMLGQAVEVHGNVVQNTSTDFSIAVWPYCSSSFPLADVSLAFVVMVLYRGQAWRAAYVPWLALSYAASILLTQIRLVLLATDAASYAWWHYGPGVSVYALAALGLSVLPPLLATGRPAEPASAEPGGGSLPRPVA